MMLVQWDRHEPREVSTLAELDALVDTLDAESREQVLPYAISLWTGPRAKHDKGFALTFVVGTETSPVEWAAPGPPYGRESWNGGTDDEPYFPANYGGERSDLEAWMPVPISDAREAARRFLTTGGQCPDNLAWHPDTSDPGR